MKRDGSHPPSQTGNLNIGIFMAKQGDLFVFYTEPRKQ